MTKVMHIGPKNKKIDDQLQAGRREAEERDAQRRADKLKLPYIDLRPTPVQVEALGLVDEEKARAAQCAPVTMRRKDVIIAAYDPAIPAIAKIVKDLTEKGYHPMLVVCSLNSLAIAWASYRYVIKRGVKITGEVELSAKDVSEAQEKFKSLKDISRSIEEFSEAQASQLLNLVLLGAAVSRASDIHIEPSSGGGRLRYRIDGELNDIGSFSDKKISSLTSRIKLISGLKLNVKNEAQDGRFTIKLREKNVEIRTSMIPSEYGETIVLRLLDPETISVEIKELGFRAEELEVVIKALARPNGMILNTGPTGSGKTSTLYAFIRHLYNPSIKIITIEDPIEYHVEGISQTQVDSKSGYTFANGLRSILRQDPDAVLVGEIRDLETAEIALHAALTGQVVFSTLHTNSAAGAIPRLVDMGVKPQIIGPAFNMVIAQRLVRKLCPHCKKPQEITPELRKSLQSFVATLPDRIHPPDIKTLQLWQPTPSGCDQCHNGYKGRIGIFELFLMSPKIEELVHDQAAEVVIGRTAAEAGMITMQQDGILKVCEGITSLDEVASITGTLIFEKEERV